MEYQVLIPQAPLSLFREEPEPCRAPEGFWVGVNRWMEMGLMAEQLVIGIPAPGREWLVELDGSLDKDSSGAGYSSCSLKAVLLKMHKALILGNKLCLYVSCSKIKPSPCR